MRLAIFFSGPDCSEFSLASTTDPFSFVVSTLQNICLTIQISLCHFTSTEPWNFHLWCYRARQQSMPMLLVNLSTEILLLINYFLGQTGKLPDTYRLALVCRSVHPVVRSAPKTILIHVPSNHFTALQIPMNENASSVRWELGSLAIHRDSRRASIDLDRTREDIEAFLPRLHALSSLSCLYPNECLLAGTSESWVI